MSPDNFQNSQVGYTRELDYSRGKLNPIMKETTKRIISIDSQYRSDKRTFSTDFTFNLSEPLKDVISLRLYSVQIPYTWYTIGKAYGNNFFYFKGRTPGIDTDTHDIKIEILAGNYKPDELITTVNSSINAIKGSITDISLGNTELSYNPNTSLTTSVIDLKKSYNESSYSIQFDSSIIPNYLGFIDTEYNCRNIRSKIDTYNLTDSFNVTENNNYFTVNVYQDNSTTVNNSFDISITLHSIEPNGNEQGAKMLHNVIDSSSKYIILFEPDYSTADKKMKKRMESNDYVRNISDELSKISSVNIIDKFIMDIQQNPDNLTTCWIMEKNNKVLSLPNKMVCPFTNGALVEDNGSLYSPKGGVIYPKINEFIFLNKKDGVFIGERE